MDSTTTATMTTTTSVKMGDASLKRKRETHAPKRSRIVIELPSKPRDYRPGSGPELQRISLLPAQDSTAYIIERILLPPAGLAADGKPLPKRMTYIVGWHDLPAARMLVPAMEVLEYVSPRALEDWEYKMETDMDEERARLETEKERAKGKTVQGANVQTATTTKPKRKRGRPPAHSQIEIAVVAEPDNEALKTGRPTTGAMSLMSPSKKRARDLAHVSDEEGSPSRQLEREMWRSSMDATTREGSMMDVDSGVVDSERSEAVTREPSADSYGPRGMGGLRKEETLSTRKSHVPRKSSVGTVAMPPSSAASSKKETPIPLPKMPGLITSQAIGPQWSVQRTPSASAGASRSFTSSNPNTPTLSTETPFTLTATRPKPTPKTKDLSQKPKKERKKPAAAKPPPPPQEPPQQQPSSADTATPAEAAWEVKRVEAVELYEVEGVGLVRYFKVLWEGDWPPDQNPSWEPEENLPATLVRNFLKRGKKKRPSAASAAAATPAAPKPKKALAQQSILSWATAGAKYKSVSEAFAGGEDDGDLLGSPADAQVQVYQEEEEDGYGVEEEFLVVEEPPPPKKSRKQGSVGWNGSATNGRGSAARFGFQDGLRYSYSG